MVFLLNKALPGECGSGWGGRFTDHATATAEMDLAHEGAASDVPEGSFYVAARYQKPSLNDYTVAPHRSLIWDIGTPKLDVEYR